VEGADKVVLLVAAATNFKRGTVSGPEPGTTCQRQLDDAARRDPGMMQAEHMADHRRYFRRASLQLGESTPAQRALPTDERIRRIQQTGARDADIEGMLFQMGRYLLICSSRPGNQAATLHGIWPGTYSRSGYNCAYHLDINIAENYWPAEVTGLSDCQEPLVDWVESLLPNARKTAKDVFDCNGAVCALNVDGWLVTGPFGTTEYTGQWIGGLGWITQNIWEHYAFNHDRDYLRNRAWPILKAVAEFYLDYNRADPKTGRLYIGPSGSPENGFVAEGKRRTVDYGISLDQELAFEIFTHCLKAADDLGIADAFTARVQKVLPRLALPGVGNDGRLLEWREERQEAEPAHRHFSHLYGFYPGYRFTLDSDPQLSAAVRKSLAGRVSNGTAEGGFGGLAWSRGWALNFLARFREPENFYRAFLDFQRKVTEPNLCKKWGGRPYCMDGNGALTAAMAEALLQSQGGVIHLLPCLPAEWASGSFTGLRARGGVTVNASWTPQSVHASFVADRDGNCQLRYGNSVEQVSLKAGVALGRTFTIQQSSSR
jgi:alpha-L-fucosidase 2